MGELNNLIQYKKKQLAKFYNKEELGDVEIKQLLNSESSKLRQQLVNFKCSDIADHTNIKTCLGYSQQLHLKMIYDIIEFFDKYLSDNDFLDIILNNANSEEFIGLLYQIFSNKYINCYFNKNHFSIVQIKQVFNISLAIIDMLKQNKDGNEWRNFMYIHMNYSALSDLDTGFAKCASQSFEALTKMKVDELSNMFNQIITAVKNSKMDINKKEDFCYSTLSRQKELMVRDINAEFQLLYSNPLFFYYKYTKDLMEPGHEAKIYLDL